MSIKAKLLSVIGISLALQAAPAAAQEVRVSGTSPVQLEEVIVTARKRQESLIDVPVVETVISQEVLERTKTDNLYGLMTRVPSLLLGNAVNSTGTQVSLRGVGTTALNATMDQSVSLNIDGLTLTQGVAYGIGMFDVAQVEVLKGPQSLFYGKNNTAGVISLTSVDPTDKFELIGRAGYESEASELQTDFIISGPVTDSLKLRLSTRYSEADGFFRNNAVATPGLGGRTPKYTNYAPSQNLILRGTALFEPGDAFTARLKLGYSHYRMDGGASPLQVALCPDGTGPVAPVANIAFIAGDDCQTGKSVRLSWADPAAFPAGVPNNGVQFEDTDQMLGSLDLNFQLSDALTLSSLTSYFDSDFSTSHSGSTTGTTVPFLNVINFDNTQFTEELRLTSDFADSALNFMLGAYYLDGDQENDVRIPFNRSLGFPLSPLLVHVVHDVDIESIAVFGQLIWDITPELELAAGARWTDEERHHAQTNLNPGNGPVGPTTLLVPEISSDHVSPDVSLTYKPTEDFTVFGSYKTGFKSGSFTSQTFVPANRDASFGDEEAKGGEVGIKTRTADRRLTANAAVYYYEYNDLQVGGLELTQLPGGGFVFAVRTLNAATATVKGVDFDVNYAPESLEGLTLTGAVNYNRARYDSFPNAPCGNGQTVSQGCDQILNPLTGRYQAQDLSGRPLVRAPEWSAFIGFNHSMPVGDNMTLDFGAGGNYMDEYVTTLVDLPGYEQDAFFKFDANIALRGADDSWELALIGNNLSNELTRGWCVNSNVQNGTVFGGQVSGAALPGPAGDDEAVCMIERGRSIWARASFKF